MTFRKAVKATASVRAHYRAGLQALAGDHSARIRCKNPQRLTGSLNLECALRGAKPNAPLWDYGIGYRHADKEVAVWVEVHPASSTSVKGMLKKLSWLKDWLHTEAPALEALTQGDYYWVSTDATIAITQNSPQAKKLAAAGLRGPKKILQLG